MTIIIPTGVRFAWMSGTTSRSHSFSGMLGTVLGGTNASASWRRFMGMNGSPNLRQQWGLDLTQLMYTPEQKATYPIYNQHPYVGNLTLGLTSLVKNEDRANSLELQLGTTARIPWRKAPSISFISCGAWNNGPAGPTSSPGK